MSAAVAQLEDDFTFVDFGKLMLRRVYTHTHGVRAAGRVSLRAD